MTNHPLLAASSRIHRTIGHDSGSVIKRARLRSRAYAFALGLDRMCSAKSWNDFAQAVAILCPSDEKSESVSRRSSVRATAHVIRSVSPVSYTHLTLPT